MWSGGDVASISGRLFSSRHKHTVACTQAKAFFSGEGRRGRSSPPPLHLSSPPLSIPSLPSRSQSRTPSPFSPPLPRSSPQPPRHTIVPATTIAPLWHRHCRARGATANQTFALLGLWSPTMAGARTTMRALAKPFLVGGSAGLAYVAYKALNPKPAPNYSDLTRGGPNGGHSSPPEVPTLPTRQEHLAKLRAASDEGTQFDLVIVGGGATGAGIALDAASRGLKVACVERDDFSSGTSSKSTKLVHGGVRYLEKAVKELDYSQYTLVREALKERAVFLTIAPHLSMSLPIMLPIYQWWKAPYFWAGTKCYDLLAGKENLESSYFLTRGKALEAFPMLRGSGLVGALVYYGKLVRSVGLAER